MEFDRLFTLADASEANNAFDFNNITNNQVNNLGSSNGEWRLANDRTPSNSTGTLPPPNYNSWVFYEASSAQTTEVPYIIRDEVFDLSTIILTISAYVDLDLSDASSIIFEYTEVVNPNKTTDWNEIPSLSVDGITQNSGTLQGTGIPGWVFVEANLSEVTSSSTVQLRVRLNLDSNFFNDFGISEWREVAENGFPIDVQEIRVKLSDISNNPYPNGTTVYCLNSDATLLTQATIGESEGNNSDLIETQYPLQAGEVSIQVPDSNQYLILLDPTVDSNGLVTNLITPSNITLEDPNA